LLLKGKRMSIPASSTRRVLKGRFPVEEAIDDLQNIDPKWRIEIGVPDESNGWIRGTDLIRADQGHFNSLLCRIGERFRTTDRKTIAASFALRFGWTACAAIAPYLIHGCVLDVALTNISLKFREDTFFERSAIHCPRGSIIGDEGALFSNRIRFMKNQAELLAELRSQLHAQAMPVVDALYEWSGFSKKGSWGQITSSWASQFVNIYDRFVAQEKALPVIKDFFAGSDEVALMQPRLHPVTIGDITHLYQRRASCCRYYLLPQGSLCPSCPLVSQEERLKKNVEWMEKQLRKKPGATM
jgi:hypothetical protein